MSAVPPPLLSSFDLAGIAEYIHAGHGGCRSAHARPLLLRPQPTDPPSTAKRIIVMTGAGLSTRCERDGVANGRRGRVHATRRPGRQTMTPRSRGSLPRVSALPIRSAGIPDFRSPGTGLVRCSPLQRALRRRDALLAQYSMLEEHGMEHPEDMFDLEEFRANPRPFYILARSMFPGRHCPTKAHAFIRVLAEKGLLLRLYTQVRPCTAPCAGALALILLPQNIDTLDRVAGLPDDIVVEAHGSFHTARCTECQAVRAATRALRLPPSPLSPRCGRLRAQPADMGEVRRFVMAGEVAHCAVCEGVVKPDITFFGESLPARFFACMREDLPKADLLVVIGSSLSVRWREGGCARQQALGVPPPPGP